MFDIIVVVVVVIGGGRGGSWRGGDPEGEHVHPVLPVPPSSFDQIAVAVETAPVDEAAIVVFLVVIKSRLVIVDMLARNRAVFEGAAAFDDPVLGGVGRRVAYQRIGLRRRYV